MKNSANPSKQLEAYVVKVSAVSAASGIPRTHGVRQRLRGAAGIDRSYPDKVQG